MRVYNIVSVVSYYLRAVDFHALPLPALQSEYLLVELVRERLYIIAQVGCCLDTSVRIAIMPA